MRSTRYYCSDVSFSPDGMQSVYVHITKEVTLEDNKKRMKNFIVALPFTTRRKEYKDGKSIIKEVHAVRGGHFTEAFKNKAGFHAVAEVYGLDHEKTIHEIDRAAHAVGGALTKLRDGIENAPKVLDDLRIRLNAAPLPIPEEDVPAWALFQSVRTVLHGFGRSLSDLEDEQGEDVPAEQTDTED